MKVKNTKIVEEGIVLNTDIGLFFIFGDGQYCRVKKINSLIQVPSLSYGDIEKSAIYKALNKQQGKEFEPTKEKLVDVGELATAINQVTDIIKPIDLDAADKSHKELMAKVQYQARCIEVIRVLGEMLKWFEGQDNAQGEENEL
jgi:hypothetical protein